MAAIQKDLKLNGLKSDISKEILNILQRQLFTRRDNWIELTCVMSTLIVVYQNITGIFNKIQEFKIFTQ